MGISNSGLIFVHSATVLSRLVSKYAILHCGCDLLCRHFIEIRLYRDRVRRVTTGNYALLHLSAYPCRIAGSGYRSRETEQKSHQYRINRLSDCLFEENIHISILSFFTVYGRSHRFVHFTLRMVEM